MKKGSKLYSIFKFKCPHCHEGAFYVASNPYRLSTAGDLLERCPVCGRKYETEPGFYYGAMYLTYAMAVATFVTVYVAMLVLFPDAPLWLDALLVIGTLVILAPLLYAWSKIMWANLFIAYKGVAETEQEREHAAKRARPASD